MTGRAYLGCEGGNGIYSVVPKGSCGGYLGGAGLLAFLASLKVKYELD